MEFKKLRKTIIFGIVFISGISLFFIFQCRNPQPNYNSVSNQRDLNAKLRNELGIDENYPALSTEDKLSLSNADARKLNLEYIDLPVPHLNGPSEELDFSRFFEGGDAWISAEESSFYFKKNEEELIEYRIIEGKIYSFLNYNLENITFIEIVDDNFYIDGKEYIINNEKLLIPK